ncbi:MAG: DUF952 domain-containing protein [Dehalococcoidia bacterium]
MKTIFHIAAAADWEAARESGSYRMSTRGQTLEDVGFIHCSYLKQTLRVANRIYQDTHGLRLLVIDPTRVAAEIRDESPDGGSERFPHIHGPLNVDAVVDVLPFEPAADGTFQLPVDRSTARVPPGTETQER